MKRVGRGAALGLVGAALLWCLPMQARSAAAVAPPGEPLDMTLVYAGEALLVPGTPPEKNVLITIRSNMIDMIEAGRPRPEAREIGGARFVDLSCCFVLPGLIDVQTHLSSERGMPPYTSRLLKWTDAQTTLRAMTHARRTLHAGFTSIRDMGHQDRSVFAVRDAIQAGRIEGPRMQVAGEIIRPTGGGLRGWFREDLEAVFAVSAICDGAADCRRAVRAEVARGADTIKVETKQDLVPGSASGFDQEELIAIRNAAHALDRKVTASAFSAASINEPLRAGFDGVVHATFADAETFRLLKKTDAYYIPTLVAARTVKEMADDPSTPVTPAWRAENRLIYDGMVASFRRALAARVKIAFGTDAGWRPHGGNAEQMVQMVELGMPAADVVKSATVNAADAMGWGDKVGSLQVGKYADLIATLSSPLADAAQLTRPVFVMKNGAVVRDDGQRAVAAAGRAPGRVNDMLRAEAALQQNPAEPVTIIHAGSVYTEPGKPVLRERTLVVRGKRIADIRAGYLTPEQAGASDARLVDLKDRFVMPGMIDAHVHITTEQLPGGDTDPAIATDADLSIIAALNAEKILRAGFTTVMDLGTGHRADELAIYAVRDAVSEGRLPGPEIRSAGSPLSMTGFSRSEKYRDKVQEILGPEGVCNGVDDCRRMVREQVSKGADFINVYHTGGLLAEHSPSQTFDDAELAAIVQTARALDRVVIADGGNNRFDAAGTNAAIKAGFSIIDTVTYPDAQTFPLLKRHGGYFAPHVHALQAAVGDSLQTLESGTMGWLPRPVLEDLFRLKQETPSALLGYRAGATLIIASDSGVFPHGDNARELVSYVQIGIPAVDALAAATLNNAKAQRIADRTGSIAIGKEADIIALGSSPLENIAAVLDVVFVMSDGRIYVEK